MNTDETYKHGPETARRDGPELCSSEWLGALEELVKSEGAWEDIIICHDDEDGFWLATVERGVSRPYPVHDTSDGAKRETLLEAIQAAIAWNNREATKPNSYRTHICAPSGALSNGGNATSND